LIILVKLYDPSLFLQKIEQSLESVVNGVMRAGTEDFQELKRSIIIIF